MQLLLIVWAGRMTINKLRDDVLLHIFLFGGLVYQHPSAGIHLPGTGDVDRLCSLPWEWHRLVHVCRRWRSIIFASPNFLDLQLVCFPGTQDRVLKPCTRDIPLQFNKFANAAIGDSDAGALSTSGKIYFDNLDNLALASGNYREIIIIARFLTPHNLAIIYLVLSR